MILGLQCLLFHEIYLDFGCFVKFTLVLAVS